MPIFGFLFGSKIGLIITVVTLGVGAFFTWLAVHDSNVRKEATNKFNQMQQETLVKKEEEFKQQTSQIQDNASRIREEIAKQLAESTQTTTKIEQQAAVETKNATNQSSPYLKSIIKQLDAVYGNKK
jgi:uncharacterized membrane protein YhiD involved in acid resistance